jgi:hypothetical protein
MKIKEGWHATNQICKIYRDKCVKADRMKSVYLFDTADSAAYYAKAFDCSDVIKVIYNASDVAGTWKPKYARGGKVIRLIPGAIAAIVLVNEVKL